MPDIRQQAELIASVEPAVEQLMAEHRERREHWYAHEYVPWEKGRSYVDEPWDESQATLSPEVRTSLVLNLLTEDNLPYYHAEIASHMPEGSAMARWTRLWTSEEAQHSIALRSYLLTSRNCDPRSLEDDRAITMEAGHSTGIPDPAGIFVYTSAQELATRVSHRNAGKIADDEVAYGVMARIAADENHHFMFYRGVTGALIENDPSTMLEAVHRVFSNFSMPGTVIPGFVRRAVDMARAGVYNLRIHHDRVLLPLIRDWGIEHMTGLSAKAREFQDKIMELPATVLRKAEVFERRVGMATG
ncbi:MAG TPA: acyl-ACP desaturase [Acidimicrobiia bacterium]|nr:acyl-ACP desaturase [Acidimicrobiia bacterium]